MKQPISIYPQDVFTDIVEAVSSKLTAQLQLIDEAITGVHFQFGSGLEIIETLKQQSDIDPFEKYPLVCMFLDVQEEHNEEAGIYSRLPELRMAIVYGTDANYKAEERDEYNFRPILTPIYQTLLEQMMYSCAFMKSGLGFEHSATRNYYWGRYGLYGKEGNIFNDKLDAIELTFRNLKILKTYCPKKCG